MGKKILVTGGAGFIGSHLVDRLIDQGKEVVCIDNFDSFYDESIKQNNIQEALTSELFTLAKGDIRDKSFLDKIFDENDISMVVHLASKVGVRPSIEEPNEYIDVNTTGTLNILEAMRMVGVKKMVFASSSSVYGNNPKVPYAETDIVDFPISVYAASKKANELLTHNYHHLYDLSVINLRFFTVYGPRQRPDLAINKFFHRIYKNVPIDIYGDGSSSRDYTFVDDTVSGIISAIDFVDKNPKVYEIINLGNSSPVLLSDLIDAIEKVTGLKFEKNYMPMQMGDVDRTYADINKAKTILNYNPKTELKAGLNKFKTWFEENLKV